MTGIMLLFFFTVVPAQEGASPASPLSTLHPKQYLCTRAAIPPVIDGKLDDPAWARASWTSDFVDIEGDKKPVPRFRTRVKMLWDDRYFYIGAELSEPQVWGTLTKRDTVIFYDDDFEVFMDPDGDNFQYGEYEMNALNTVWDLFLPKPYKDGGHPDDGWNIAEMKSAVHILGTVNNPLDTDSGWTAEIAFPWASLERCSHRTDAPVEGDQWRVNFSRVEWMVTDNDGTYRKVPDRREDNWVWSPQGVVDMHRPETWGYVQFTSRSADSVQLKTDPSLPAREVLMSLYYAERNFFDHNKQWTLSPGELKIKLPGADAAACCPVLQLTPDGYTATVTLKLANGGTQHWSIRQDSFISKQ
jgi:hypothetical protein